MPTYFVLGSPIKVMKFGLSVFPTGPSQVTEQMIFSSLKKNMNVKQSAVLFDYDNGNEDILQGEIYLFQDKEIATKAADIASQNHNNGVAAYFANYFPIIEVSIKEESTLNNTKTIQDKNGMNSSYEITLPVIDCNAIDKIHGYSYKYGSWKNPISIAVSFQEEKLFQYEDVEFRSKCTIS